MYSLEIELVSHFPINQRAISLSDPINQVYSETHFHMSLAQTPHSLAFVQCQNIFLSITVSL